MASVWVVEYGEYSEYRVVGVFSTKENAQKMADNAGGTVDEWPLDPWIEELNQGRDPYFVVMKRDGSTLRVEKDDFRGLREKPHMKLCGERYHRWANETVLLGVVIAIDEIHAVKIANEIRAQMIAAGEWPE